LYSAGESVRYVRCFCGTRPQPIFSSQSAIFEDALGVVGIVLADAFEVCLCFREKFE